MKYRELSVEGAYEFTPTAFPDERGLFVSPFQEPTFLEAVGQPFTVAQTNHSKSKRGVIRGIHYTSSPGQTKYVYCPRGQALDIVVDIRVGSPTFGAYDIVQVDPESFRAVYFPIGMGHAFVALEDSTVMSYMVSSSYDPKRELAVHPLDPTIGIPWPADINPVISARDTAAPTLEQAKEQGLLPTYRA
ncbi:dTDP-4-keto-6-deoxy-D-glucose epimerase [Nocardiopsis gilva YIM 90087]|uniref:dTDP-4-keto-6-deoxy-D-glucose epimerase n=1 Tax=Nocardiopsis gilva YIM 90087 TaxID=1235441 RepID=A0A223S163_9ACTN|nr:dTDP-4-dehydrorhamnose 3,5-epimerase [Nocardiopsis gilva]ASU81858.1 dTDP-4-keto-6-deoxy-D-glucose epimerase [Nocardiopsis gilva YIM 90087]